MTSFSFDRRMLILASAIALAAVAAPAARAQEQAQLPQVSDQHKFLHKDVGTWDATMRIFPMEGAEPVESKATETNELFQGGMWLVSRFKGEIFGAPFSGMGPGGIASPIG